MLMIIIVVSNDYPLQKGRTGAGSRQKAASAARRSGRCGQTLVAREGASTGGRSLRAGGRKNFLPKQQGITIWQCRNLTHSD